MVAAATCRLMAVRLPLIDGSDPVERERRQLDTLAGPMEAADRTAAVIAGVFVEHFGRERDQVREFGWQVVNAQRGHFLVTPC